LSSLYGLYTPGETIIHRLDPRSKFLWFIVVLALSISFSDPRFNGLIYVSIIAVGLLARLTPKRFLFVAFNSLVFIVACLVFWPRRAPLQVGEVVFTIPLLNWKYTEIGLLYAFGKAFLILNPITCMLIILSTTFPRDAVQATMKAGLPYKAGYIFIIALRFIPVMASETREIVEAQMSRGLEMQRGNIIKKIKNYIPIFVPLVARMVKFTVQLAMSMESRCFGAKENRTFLHELKMKSSDYVWIACLVLAVVLGFYLRFILGVGYIPVKW